LENAVTGQLLTTKLCTPRQRPDLVSRPRLTEQLTQGLRAGHKLTLLSAPPGFGKTTLIVNWKLATLAPALRYGASAGVENCLVAWLSLDEGDNDPICFLTYVVAALQTVQPGLGETALAMLRAPQPPPVESILTALLNDVAAVENDVMLVLDDYHAIKSPPIHNAVEFMLDHLPEQMHLVIATRADPPLPLPRLRARDELTELRSTDLRFTPDEAAAFLNQIMRLNLSAQDVAVLEARTEGWIAGLQLAALSMRGREPEHLSDFIAAFSGSHRYILDYLAEEVLQRQPQDVQSFLLQTSFLDRLSGPLCDAVTGQANSQATLAQLEHANLFLVTLDDKRHWYRYHRLFADLLHARLRESQPERLPELHTRAAEWLERNGFTSEAVRHALAAGEFDRAVRLVEQTAMPMLRHAEMSSLMAWVKALPPELARRRPWLCICQAWALTLTGQLDATQPWLEDAERTWVDISDTLEMRGHIAAIRAYALALRGDVLGSIELAHQALALLPESDLSTRSVVAFTLAGTHYTTGDFAQAGEAFSEAARMGRAGDNLHLAVPAQCALGGLRVMQGQLRQAEQIYREALQWATEYGGAGFQATGNAMTGLGNLLREWNDLEAAATIAAQGIEHSQRWGSADALAAGYVVLSRIRQAQGDAKGALDAFGRVEQLLFKYSVTPAVSGEVGLHRVRLWLAQGDLASAALWLQERRSDPREMPPFMREPEHIMQARVLIAQSRGDPRGRPPDVALNLLAGLSQSAEDGGRFGRLIEILVLQALAHQMRGNTSQAIATLEKVLTLAEPQGYVRIFVDEGEPMRLLIADFGLRIADRRLRQYADHLLPAFLADNTGAAQIRNQKPATLAPHASAGVQNLVEPLSDRELEVLRLLIAGQSYDEIAQVLVISQNTVKTHVKNIYGKLEVSHRREAMAKAKELGLA
jgi:LuxR family transcriptional regulator, maltose regulon positive regulatory protein